MLLPLNQFHARKPFLFLDFSGCCLTITGFYNAEA